MDWRRLEEVCAIGGKRGAKLFSGEVEPADICQGQLGDCWLMSALACLAKFEGAIARVFLTRECTAYGRYRIQLYDKLREKWVTIVIDDWIPCHKGTTKPVFAKPNGDEAWVLLLEKAMAKFKGSYAALDGGSTLWALECLTGDLVFKFKYDENLRKWKRYDMVQQRNAKTGQIDVMLREAKDVLTNEEAFQNMLYFRRRESVIAASTGSGNDTQNTNGIVHGHAYTVMTVKEVESFLMVRLRNPWGTFEWTGNWSDKSPLWQQYPKVAKALQTQLHEDGSFWMEFKDFISYFKNIDFCCRTTGWDDLRLNLYEEHPVCGPTWGCIAGCFTYWFCCRGVRALCCSRRSAQYGGVQYRCGGCCKCACCAV